MNALLGFTEWWSRTLWALSWQIGVLVAVIWLASLVSRRASPNFRYWLWCIVLVRLCVPATLALPAGVSGDIRRAVETSLPPAFVAAQRAAMQPVAPRPGTGDSIPVAASSDAPESQSGTRVVSGTFPELSLGAKFALGWTLVFLGLLSLTAAKSLRVGRMLKRWPEVQRPELLSLIDSLRSRCAIGRAIRVRMFPAAQPSQGPAVIGIWRPTILLPAAAAERWSLDELEPVLLHELAHVKRWDLLVNLVQTIIQAAYFFHPLVWLVNARIRQERELVCDDLAVLHSGGRCKRYSQSFVRVLEETSDDAPFLEVAGVGMTERRKPLARRIVRMMSKDYRFYRPLGWFSALMLLLMSGIAIAVASERTAAPSAPANSVSDRQQTDARAPEKERETQYITEMAIMAVAKDASLPEKDMLALPPSEDLVEAAVKSLAEAENTPNEIPKNFRLLANPLLTIVQGQPGNVVIGQEIPFRTSQAAPALSDKEGGIQFKDVGLKASITVAPEDGQGKIGMDLRVEISDEVALTPGQESAADYTNTRAIRSHAFEGHFVLDLQRGYLLKPDIMDSEGTILFAVRVSLAAGAGEGTETGPSPAASAAVESSEPRHILAPSEPGKVEYEQVELEGSQQTNAARSAEKVEAQWPDDFESYASGVGTWPAGWIADGNADQHDVCYVDGTTFKDTHGNTLRLHGDSPGWSPLAHRKSGLAVPFQITFDVYLDSQGPDSTCVVGVREWPSWTAAGAFLFDTSPPGEVKGLESVAAGGVVSQGQATGEVHMERAKWYHVELTLREAKGRQTLTITLDDGTAVQGPAQLSSDAIPVEDMHYLQLEVRTGTAWFDNVSVAAAGVAAEQAGDEGLQPQHEVKPELLPVFP